MNAKPILMQPDMVRATLREIREPGTGKSQTRRVLPKAAAEAVEFVSGGPDDAPGAADNLGLMYGQHEDDAGEVHNAEWLVYCAECPEEGVIPIGHGYGQPGDVLYVRESFGFVTWPPWDSPYLVYKADSSNGFDDAGNRVERFKPSIHMPRRYSRITLELTEVRVERVQDISEADALADGGWEYKNCPVHKAPERSFSALWDRINAARGYGWDTNPWVWVLSYKPHLINVDEFISGKQT